MKIAKLEMGVVIWDRKIDKLYRKMETLFPNPKHNLPTALHKEPVPCCESIEGQVLELQRYIGLSPKILHPWSLYLQKSDAFGIASAQTTRLKSFLAAADIHATLNCNQLFSRQFRNRTQNDADTRVQDLPQMYGLLAACSSCINTPRLLPLAL